MSRVLVVDDNAENVYLLQALLTAQGHEVGTASNGREALEEALRCPPELIVTDILMPVMDGFSLCRQWRSEERLREIPFIFYTATYTDPRDEEFALSLGADRFVVKPQDPEVLLGIVEEAMQAGRKRREPDGNAEAAGETVFLQEYNQALIRKLEAKLVQLEEANKTLVVKEFAIASAASGILLADLSGTLTYANPAAAAIWGCPGEAMTGRNLADLMSEPAEAARMKTALEDPGHWKGEGQARRADGTAFTVRMAVHRVRDPQGAAVCTMATCLDVTEENRMREALQRAQKMESLSLFAAGVAHDFNNLLTGLFGGLELIRDDIPAKGPARDRYATAMSAFSRAKDLTQRLLAFSKGGTPVRGKVDMAEIVRESCALSLSGSRIRYEMTVEKDTRGIEADAGQLSQVCNNLILNARQAMKDQGLIRIAVGNSLLREGNEVMLPQGEYVTVLFQDDGPGIPENVLPKIFDPFFTTKRDGSGLGLPTSYAILKSHGGHIEADSREGEGASFRIWLPACGTRKDKERQDPVPEPALGEGRILLMDDEEAIRDLARTILSRAGYQVTAVSHGEEAKRAFHDAMMAGPSYDLAILDLTIRGGMGGEDTLAALRSDDPDVVAVASTGYSDQDALSRAKRQGFLGLLPKPYLAHELLSTVKAAIGDRTRGRVWDRGRA